jgi:hypothetical protein
LDGFETTTGCGPGWSIDTDASTGLEHRVALACGPGASMDEYVVPGLTHTWNSNDAMVPTLGINTTIAVGNWLGSQWGLAPN